MHFMKSSPNRWMMRQVGAQSILNAPGQRVVDKTGAHVRSFSKKHKVKVEGEFYIGQSILGEEDMVVYKNGDNRGDKT